MYYGAIKVCKNFQYIFLLFKLLDKPLMQGFHNNFKDYVVQ